MRLQRLILLAAALAGGGLVAACTDVPFAPHWEADWTVPLPVASIVLSDNFPTSVILPGMSGSVSIPVQTQTLDQAVGQVLTQDISRAILKLHYTMTLPLAGADTLFIADSLSALTSASPNRIVLPIPLVQTGAAGADAADTLVAGSPGLALLRRAGASNAGSLYILVRGSVRNPGTGSIVLTSADVIGLSLEMTARIAISK
jgi:hypothetical protein